MTSLIVILLLIIYLLFNFIFPTWRVLKSGFPRATLLDQVIVAVSFLISFADVVGAIMFHHHATGHDGDNTGKVEELGDQVRRVADNDHDDGLEHRDKL